MPPNFMPEFALLGSPTRPVFVADLTLREQAVGIVGKVFPEESDGYPGTNQADRKAPPKSRWQFLAIGK